MTDAGKIDTSPEAVAAIIAKCRKPGWKESYIANAADLLEALSARLAACERERDDARVELAAIRAAYDKATGGKTSLVEAFDNLNATISTLRSAVEKARVALEGVIAVADRKTVEFDRARSARAALAAAEKGEAV